MAKTGKLLAAYLVVGADELKRTSAVARLKGYLDESLAVFNLDEIYATPELEPDAVISSLNTMPVGDSPRIVIVHDAEKLPKPVSEAIISYLADPNPSCTLLVCAASLSRGTRLYKALAKVGPRSVIDCTPASRRDMPDYLEKLARSHGITLSRDAARALVDRVGDSTTMLDTQLRTLAELKGGQGTVTLADVERQVARVVEVKPWEFLDRLSSRDMRRSLELYGLMRSQWQKPDYSRVGLLSQITTRIRELICARSLDGRGEARSIASVLNKQDWQVKNHVRWARGFGPGELERCLRACAECERSLKGTPDSDTAMVMLITTICR